jgi:hypothetical protein
MRVSAWLAAALVTFPALARAQEPLPPIPPECQALPQDPLIDPYGYASAPPAAQDGSYPPPVILPPLGAPELPPPPPPPLPQDAWRYRLDARGELWRERTVHKPHAHGVWISGLALFLSGYLGSAPGWFSGLGAVSVIGPWPVFGALVNGAVTGGPASAGWIMSGVGQLSGLVLIFVGAGAGGKKVQRERVQYSVAPLSGGVASTLTVRF